MTGIYVAPLGVRSPGSSSPPWLIAVPFLSGFLDEGSGWLVRFVHPGFAYLKIASFLLLQGSLAALIIAALWAVFTGSQHNLDSGLPED